jgi:hypothetical protein
MLHPALRQIDAKGGDMVHPDEINVIAPFQAEWQPKSPSSTPRVWNSFM